MPRIRKYPKAERSINCDFRDILPKPPIQVPSSEIQQKRNAAGQDEMDDGIVALSQVPTGSPTTFSGINSSGSGTGTGGSESSRNDRSLNSHPRTERVPLEEAMMRMLKPRLTQPSDYRIYAVTVESVFGTQPLLAVFDSTKEYSCVRAMVAERTLNTKLRLTTPGQRMRWYSTPAGQIYEPQRYAELTLRAFDPYIPTVELTVLLLEDDGPINGVHMYLGRSVFTKLAALGIQLSVREMNESIPKHGNDIMSALQGPAVATDSDSSLRSPNISDPFDPLPTSTVSSAGLYPMSQRTTLFSEAPSCPSTITSFDSAYTPMNSMAEFMKHPDHDIFLGYVSAESTTHEGGQKPDTINPAMLSELSQDYEDPWLNVAPGTV
ncbi:hypothetical protein DM02DRAFT_674762 [Periconia macrospinosa]|uniref:Uncharacterized protein n=1 Tax=Periconia macrospinosa TaxID=97972 RepID=A0A2V1DG19_9PLEO|nr:hypothetical protein DM02DRAFT_674762 [Periconia macrospinosa]